MNDLLNSRPAPQVHPRLRERTHAVFATYLISWSIQRTEIKRIWVRIRRVHVVFRLEVGVGIAMTWQRWVGGEVYSSDDEDKGDEGEEDPDAVGEAERLLVETRQLFGGVVVVGRPAFLDAARGSDVDVRCALSSATLHGDGGGM